MNKFIVAQVTAYGNRVLAGSDYDDYLMFQKVVSSDPTYHVFEDGKDVTNRYKKANYTPDPANTKEAVSKATPLEGMSQKVKQGKVKVVAHYINNRRVDMEESIDIPESSDAAPTENIAEPEITVVINKPAPATFTIDFAVPSVEKMKPAAFRALSDDEKYSMAEQADGYKASGKKRNEIFELLGVTEATYDELSKWRKTVGEKEKGIENTLSSSDTNIVAEIKQPIQSAVSATPTTHKRGILGVRR